jgi:hypothetical protein
MMKEQPREVMNHVKLQERSIFETYADEKNAPREVQCIIFEVW